MMKLSKSELQKLRQYFAKQKDILAVYLYGSFAKRTTHKRSDMDFAILFDGKVNLYHRLGQVYSDLSNLRLLAEPEVREINLNQSPAYLLNVINGELIFNQNNKQRINFEVAVMNLFRDTEFLRSLKYDYMKKSFEEGTYGYRLLNS